MSRQDQISHEPLPPPMCSPVPTAAVWRDQIRPETVPRTRVSPLAEPQLQIKVRTSRCHASGVAVATLVGQNPAQRRRSPTRCLDGCSDRSTQIEFLELLLNIRRAPSHLQRVVRSTPENSASFFTCRSAASNGKCGSCSPSASCCRHARSSAAEALLTTVSHEETLAAAFSHLSFNRAAYDMTTRANKHYGVIARNPWASRTFGALQRVSVARAMRRLAQLATGPVYAVSPDRIRFLESPRQYFDTLTALTRSSQRRVFLSGKFRLMAVSACRG